MLLHCTSIYVKLILKGEGSDSLNKNDIWPIKYTKDPKGRQGLTITKVHQAAFAIILDEKYKIYAKAMTYLNRVTLSTRRSEPNLNFAKKCLKSDRYQHWFKLNKPTEQISKTRRLQLHVVRPPQSKGHVWHLGAIGLI